VKNITDGKLVGRPPLFQPSHSFVPSLPCACTATFFRHGLRRRAHHQRGAAEKYKDAHNKGVSGSTGTLNSETARGFRKPMHDRASDHACLPPPMSPSVDALALAVAVSCARHIGAFETLKARSQVPIPARRQTAKTCSL
jgi:hypothetical protein